MSASTTWRVAQNWTQDVSMHKPSATACRRPDALMADWREDMFDMVGGLAVPRGADDMITTEQEMPCAEPDSFMDQ